MFKSEMCFDVFCVGKRVSSIDKIILAALQSTNHGFILFWYMNRTLLSSTGRRRLEDSAQLQSTAVAHFPRFFTEALRIQQLGQLCKLRR